MTYPMPLLMFASPEGLALPRFNTLRLGGAWGKRLKKGDRVLLATKLEVIGSATVFAIEVGKARYMVEKYAAVNHTELSRQGGAWSNPDAQQRVLELMQKTYGPRAFTETRNVTAIWLKR